MARVRQRQARRRSILTRFIEPLLTATGRMPIAVADLLARGAKSLVDRVRRRRRKAENRLPDSFRGNNHLRRDIGLPPVDANDWRL
jgi:hypothetical protein